MRKSDSSQVTLEHYHINSKGPYIDPEKPLEQMSLDELKNTLCGKANGDFHACEACKSRCKFGRRVVELLMPEEEPEKTRKGCSMKKVNTEIRYLQAYASGNASDWLKAKGYTGKATLWRCLKFCEGMTVEDAKARLEKMGVAVDEPEPVVEPAPVEVPADVKTANSTLKIAAIEGKFFNYYLSGDTVKISLYGVDLNVVVPDELDAMCEEMKAAVALMTGGKACTR